MEAKAKELKPYVEKFLTHAKNNPTLAGRRFLLRFLSEKTVKKLMEEARKIGERRGGYTRIVKLGPRKRDGAKMAILELVE